MLTVPLPPGEGDIYPIILGLFGDLNEFSSVLF